MRRWPALPLYTLLAVSCWLYTGPARAGLPVQPDPIVEAQVDSLVRAAVDYTFGGRLDEGFRAMDRAQEIAPRDPRIGLTRFRLLRENYPNGVFEQERARSQEPALLAELEHTITICDSILELNEDDPAARLYRGWAYINKAQTYLMARRMRAAAGASRSGKSDLDKFYEHHPQGDPDAATVMGAYLYYADTLPGFFKFLRWLLRIPGGDRERGLELLQAGAAGDGYTQIDAQLVLAVTYYLFDGEIEKSVAMLANLARQYPKHPWTVLYSYSLAFMYPGMTARAIAAESKLLDGWDVDTRGWGDAAKYRIVWSRCRLYLQLGRFDDALVDMENVVDGLSEFPNWIVPRAHLMAIELAGDLGRGDEIDRLCGRVPENDNYNSIRESIKTACARETDKGEAEAFVALGDVRHALYTGYVEKAARLLQQATDRHGTSVYSRYLEAEVARERGLLFDALDIYVEAERLAINEELDLIRTFVLVREAEIFIDLRDYDRATQSYEKARGIEPEETLFANVIRARLRYIDRQKK